VALIFVLTGLALCSVGLNLWQWIAACRFPIHKRERIDPNKQLGITLLKPLKGCDSETLGSIESWFRQDYSAPVQILFGVAWEDDPVCDVVRSLIAKYPDVSAELVICSKDLGANGKVSTLIQLELLASHPFVIVSDADVSIPTDFFAQMICKFSEPEVGLVNCFYRLENTRNAAMQWEAIAINADFWSQVLQGNSIWPMDFALGAAMAIRRDTLHVIGGFASLAHFLADDYQLGNKIAKTGATISLTPIVASCRGETMGFREVWDHQLRWARTIRVCQPLPWFCSILSNATFWPLLAAVVLRSSSSIGLLAAALFLRIATALHNEFRLAQHKRHLAYFWLVPIKDLLQFALWAASFLGSTVVWRGMAYRVLGGGKLVIAK